MNRGRRGVKVSNRGIRSKVVLDCTRIHNASVVAEELEREASTVGNGVMRCFQGGM